MNLFALILSLNLSFVQSESNPIELGKVNWLRDYDKAIEKAKTEDKEVLILFQEVPGCHTCTSYGANILSHPLIVEAIESYFVPLAIFNNKEGEDRRILEKYGEPSWNNPVVRIVNERGDDHIKRIAGNYSELGLINGMIDALLKAKKPVPEYLKLIQTEYQSLQNGTQEAIFSMYCFWTGEKELGKLNGVVHTNPGFMNGKEVVSIEYDPSIIAYSELINIANNSSCASTILTDDEEEKEIVKDQFKSKLESPGNFKQDRQPKYYLNKSKYRSIPMTRMQQTKVNSLIAIGQSPDHLLSPRQLEVLKNEGNENFVDREIITSWYKSK